MPSFTTFSAALLGLSAFATAAPSWRDGSSFRGQFGGHHGGFNLSHTSEPSSAQTPFKFPLANGFPNITDPVKLNETEEQAHGTLSNAPPPVLHPDTLTSLRLIAFNEIFEVAYFTSLIKNITENQPGYQIPQHGVRDFVLNALIAVQAQEELHTLNANGALAANGADQIQACEYVFPVDNFDDAINLASKFTDVVLGTLQDVQQDAAEAGDAGLVRAVGSVIGQEGEQNGYYRSLEGKIPSALPFLTTSTRQFAFSALNQNFVVKGSCPNIGEIDLPIFGVLNILTADIEPKDQLIQFSVASNGSYSSSSLQGLSLVYINQQNLPIVETIQNVKTEGDMITFEANFPFVENLMNGLTIAAVAKGDTFANADEVAAATLFGPGLIEIN